MSGRRALSALWLVIAGSALLVIFGGSAYAYVDPGTGSYVFQVVVASLLAAAFVVKSTWRSIRDAISRRMGKRSEDDK